MTLPWGCISKYLCFCSCCLKQVPQRSLISIKKNAVPGLSEALMVLWSPVTNLSTAQSPLCSSRGPCMRPHWGQCCVHASVLGLPPKGQCLCAPGHPSWKKDLFMKSQIGRIHKHCVQTDAHFMYNSSGFTLCIIHLNRLEGQVWPGNTSSK